MKIQANSLAARLRISGAFIVAGLLVQAVSLFWNHPLSFIAFATIGALFLAIGIVLYLFTLVSLPIEKPEQAEGVSTPASQS
jgi:hypothetical protein